MKQRWWIGAAVLVTAVVILVLKAQQGRSASLASEGSQSTLKVATGAPIEGPMPAMTRADTAPAATLPESAIASTPTLEPMPADPVGQIRWASTYKKPMMILFHSTNCIPCKMMEKLVGEVRGDYEPGVVFVDVITNDRANLPLIRQAGIQAIPTSFFIKPSGQGKRYVGAMQEDVLKAELANLLAEE